jgi:hypothetical protein
VFLLRLLEQRRARSLQEQQNLTGNGERMRAIPSLPACPAGVRSVYTGHAGEPERTPGTSHGPPPWRLPPSLAGSSLP